MESEGSRKDLKNEGWSWVGREEMLQAFSLLVLLTIFTQGVALG
jgi:hypothetical protein